MSKMVDGSRRNGTGYLFRLRYKPFAERKSGMPDASHHEQYENIPQEIPAPANTTIFLKRLDRKPSTSSSTSIVGPV